MIFKNIMIVSMATMCISANAAKKKELFCWPGRAMLMVWAEMAQRIGIPNFTRTVGWNIKNLNFNHYGSKTLRQIVQGTCSQIKL